MYIPCVLSSENEYFHVGGAPSGAGVVEEDTRSMVTPSYERA